MIEVRNLTKRFGRFTAVDDLSFTVGRGEAVALWGANGAGKTTAVRCLLNLFPYEGEITINGLDARRQSKEVRRLIGFVPQELSFHDDMSVAETLVFYARLKKAPDGFDFEPLLERLRLTEHVQKRVGELSGGLKQRLALAVALLSDPPILVLDEPTASLDIRSREEFLTLLRELKRAGKTLVFSSHHLEEITALADRVLLLEGGRLAAVCASRCGRGPRARCCAPCTRPGWMWMTSVWNRKRYDPQIGQIRQIFRRSEQFIRVSENLPNLPNLRINHSEPRTFGKRHGF